GVDNVEEFVAAIGFAEECGGAVGERIPLADVGSGQDDDGDGGGSGVAGEASQDFAAAQFREAMVEEDQVGPGGSGGRQSFFAGIADGGSIAGLLEHIAQSGDNRLFVIDNQDQGSPVH